jgi:hypothetical protein
VSHNPGHPLEESDEVPFWRNDLGLVDQDGNGPTRPITGNDAERMLTFCSCGFLEPGSSGNFTFHRKVAGYARACLKMLGLDHTKSAWLDHCWFTDAFKCTTRKENGPPITEEMYEMCLDHLRREVETLRPRAILALGGRAHEQVLKLSADVPIVKFRLTSNGCPQLQSRALDRSFAEFAEKVAGRSPEAATAPDFLDFRLTIQRELFPRVLPHARH